MNETGVAIILYVFDACFPCGTPSLGPIIRK